MVALISRQQLQELVDLFNERAPRELRAHVHVVHGKEPPYERGEYLIAFGQASWYPSDSPWQKEEWDWMDNEGGSMTLLVMGDLGITNDPGVNTPTPKLGQVSLDDLEGSVADMIRIAHQEYTVRQVMED